MELVERAEGHLTGIRVSGAFEDLRTIVPEAWQRLAAAGAPPGLEYAELSRRGPDGRYEEVVGIVTGGQDVPARLVDTSADVALTTASVPAGRWVRHEHTGPVEQIAESFGRAISWAHDKGLEPTGELLDTGYRLDGGPERHVLWVRVHASGAATAAGE